MTFVPTVAPGGTTLWAPGGVDSMTIKPSTVTATHCCNTPNTVSVIAYAVNSVTNPATDTIDITFTDVPPLLVTPIANQVFYNGQGAVTLNGLSITSTRTLTFSIATNVTSADYTALSIDTTDGDPITISMATSFIGTATFTVSATDTTGLVTTTTFDIVVGVCVQSDCSICTSAGANACTTCDTGYTLLTGTCYIPEVVPEVIPEPVIPGPDYLNTGISDAD
jgi:hypothetical protein